MSEPLLAVRGVKAFYGRVMPAPPARRPSPMTTSTSTSPIRPQPPSGM